MDAAWRLSARTASALGLGCLALLLLISERISRSIFPRLQLLVRRANKIATNQGDFSQVGGLSLEEASPANEIDVLFLGFNEMLTEIRKRDERLRNRGEELEQMVGVRTAELQSVNRSLASAHAEIALFLQSIPSILIGLDSEGRIRRWNVSASRTFGVEDKDALGKTLPECGIKWLHPNIDEKVSRWLSTKSILRCDDVAYEKEQTARFVGFSVRPFLSPDTKKMAFIVTGADVTEKKCLEEQLRQAQKLEAIGQLAAGIAHEINTPTQFVGENTAFLKDSWGLILSLLSRCRRMQQSAAELGAIPFELLAEFHRLSEECDFSYLEREVPRAIDESLEGLHRVASIVRAMSEFGYRGRQEKEAIDINRAIEATITVARAEWRHVADLATELDPSLPMVTGSPGEIKQVILNLIVNAAHAISEVVGDGSQKKGSITISTRRDGDSVLVSIADTGTGIPSNIRSRVFEPFFTTKPVGKGTGQGLSLSHSIIVKGHHGKMWFDSEPGQGTTFFLSLPVRTSAKGAAQ